jgi:diketogulonate reductase-like aldo/keto reductase
MQIPTKKLKNGFEMPVFGLGTWLMGGTKIRNTQNDDARDIEAIQNAVSMGVTHIDTAENYAEGHTETLVGHALQGYDRNKLFIVTKVDTNHLGYDDVLRSCQNSLSRLRIEHVDLYLIHKPNDTIPLTQTIRAMDRLVQEGLTKYIGVSNFSTKRLIDAQKYTQNKLVINQVYYNLAAREPEHEGLLEYCQNNDVLLEAYRPLEKGVLLAETVPVLHKIATKYGKTPSQIVINWLVSQKNVITISKSVSKQHLKENLGALGWQMESEDIEMLRNSFPNQKAKSDDLPLR